MAGGLRGLSHTYRNSCLCFFFSREKRPGRPGGPDALVLGQLPPGPGDERTQRTERLTGTHPTPRFTEDARAPPGRCLTQVTGRGALSPRRAPRTPPPRSPPEDVLPSGHGGNTLAASQGHAETQAGRTPGARSHKASSEARAVRSVFWGSLTAEEAPSGAPHTAGRPSRLSAAPLTHMTG